MATFKRLIKEYNIFLLLIALIVVPAFTIKVFTSIENIEALLIDVSIFGLMAIGMTFVMLLGAFDMSVGVQVALGTVLLATFWNAGLGVAALLLMIASLMAIGFINGIIITKFKVNPFIATLGMMVIVKGIALIVSDAKTIICNDEAFLNLFSMTVFGIPLYVWVILIVAVLSEVALRFTRFGYSIYVLGGNIEAAKLGGIAVNRLQITCFVILSFCCGLAAILLGSRSGAGSSVLGDTFTLQVISACVIGGIRLSGGYGNIFRTMAGILIITIVKDVVNLLGIFSYIQTLIMGVLLILVMVVDRVSQKSEEY